jgi:ActR/RegA family two-component response regulator
LVRGRRGHADQQIYIDQDLEWERMHRRTLARKLEKQRVK